jgi:hypothetical protein
MKAIKGMTHDEFHDWLIFESPEHENHYRTIQILRYCATDSIDKYVSGMRATYENK